MTSQKTNTSPMSFEDFARIVADALILNPEKLTPESHFITDLAVDSIRLVELYLRFQELGIEIPEDAVWQIQTVGDAYQYYRENISL